jgi:hypothetical protein
MSSQIFFHRLPVGIVSANPSILPQWAMTNSHFETALAIGAEIV